METLKPASTAATQRLRKTFKYPTDSSDEDTLEGGLDEQDKAQILSTLQSHDKSTTYTYTLILLALPLLPLVLYLPRLFSVSTLPSTIVAMASLLATAYTLYFLPLPPTEMEPIDGVPKNPPVQEKKRKIGIYNPTPSWETSPEKAARRPVPYISASTADKVADYIVPINRAVCGLLALYEVWQQREWSEGFMVGGGFLPGVICLAILWARTELRIIDMAELERVGGAGEGGKEM